ncbi:3-methyl-2-oxobutanoate hydroxymethyltransferase, partial [Serratia marcescens]|nr:3-methyl-2-oxobutanoate hydroxymethyltransferase [Serratia marcescens]
GGEEMEETVDFLVRRGIPVLAHIGLMPQQVNAMGGFKAQGRDPESAERVRRDGLAMQRGGAFAVVIEGVGEPLARRLSEELAIPCIGIGA